MIVVKLTIRCKNGSSHALCVGMSDMAGGQRSGATNAYSRAADEQQKALNFKQQTQ